MRKSKRFSFSFVRPTRASLTQPQLIATSFTGHDTISADKSNGRVRRISPILQLCWQPGSKPQHAARIANPLTKQTSQLNSTEVLIAKLMPSKRNLNLHWILQFIAADHDVMLQLFNQRG